MKRNDRTALSAFLRILPWIVTLLAAAAVGYYILFPGWGYFHSDCTDTILWAQASYDAGSLFNPDFEYACLLPFGGQLLMLPFIGLFGVSTTTHAIGMLLFLLLFTASLLLLGRALKWTPGWSAALAALTLLLLSSSDKLREIFWGHIIYYSLGILFLIVGLGLTLSALSALEERNGPLGKKAIAWIAGSAVWMFLCSTNGLQAMTIFAIPLLAGLAGERFFDTRRKWADPWNRTVFLFAVLLAASAGIGWVTGGLLERGLTQGYFDAYSNFSPPDKWMDNLMSFLPAWLTLLGADVRDGAPLTDGEGLLNLIRIGFGLILLAVPVAMTVCYRRFSQRGVRILLIAHWTMTALILMAYVFGYLSSANWRLSPILASSILLLVVFSHWIATEAGFPRFCLLTLGPAALAALIALSAVLGMPHDYGRQDGLPALAQYLEDSGLSYGYATFWNSQAITVLSDSAVKVRNINLDEDGGISIYGYQSNRQWFEPQEGQEQYFLLLTQYEYDQLDVAAHPELEGQETLEYNDYRIVLLEECPFA